MANEFVISRVKEAPALLHANTMYIIKKDGEANAKLLFTGNDPMSTASTVGFDDVDTIATKAAEDAVKAGQSVFVVKTITAMNALVVDHPALAYVEDTSEDPLAKNPTGGYVYDPVNAYWLPLPAGGGTGTTVKWADILNGPTATPSQIDSAVAASHTHANRPVLDKLSDQSGKLAFNGSPVSEVNVTTSW